MNTNNSQFFGGEKQLQEISSKTLDPIATEVSEILIMYNEDLDENDKEELKSYLENGIIEDKKYGEKFQKIIEIVNTRSDSIKEYCLVKIKTQDQLFEDLMEE